jgi:catechol 2,3-dioxygenase-like lactoylglutathione lyase family enzyme
MIKITEVAFTCYAVSDMPRSRAFYERILGLTPGTVEDTEYGVWVEYELGPHTLTLGNSPGFAPSKDGATAGLEVEDFDAAIADLKQKEVRFRIEPFNTPVCRMAMILDPDDNTLIIHKRNPR